MLGVVLQAQLLHCDPPVDKVQIGRDVFSAARARESAGVTARLSGLVRVVAVSLWQGEGESTLLARAHIVVEGDQKVARRFERVVVVSDGGECIGELRVLVVVAYAWSGAQPGIPGFQWPAGGGTVFVGHRGFGSTWRRLGVAENTVCAFETAFRQGLRWAEFDVQLTRDLVPVLFHDVLLQVAALPGDGGVVKVALKELEAQQLQHLEFRAPQLPARLKRSASEKALPTHRRGEGAAAQYAVNDPFPTMERVLRDAPQGMGFNVELKFAEWRSEEGYYVDRSLYLDVILNVLCKYSGSRGIVLSSFDPDLCYLAKQKQTLYPVLFLTEGGVVLTEDPRKDSLEAARDWAVLAQLDGVVADVTSVLPKRAEVVAEMQKLGLLVFTYGSLNNEPAFVQQQRELRVDGIITDRWQMQHV